MKASKLTTYGRGFQAYKEKESAQSSSIIGGAPSISEKSTKSKKSAETRKSNNGEDTFKTKGKQSYNGNQAESDIKSRPAKE